MLTAKITLESIKDSDAWSELGFALGFDDEKISKIFEYSEFGSIEIEVDENLNIVGGKVIPFKD